jgi:hypothetical protein
MMVLQRKRRGQIVCATFRPEQFDSYTRRNPNRPTIPTGTYYSREELVDNHWLWQFRPAITPNQLSQVMGERAECEDVDVFLKTIARAVALSCIVAEKEKPSGAVKAAHLCSLGDRKFRELRKQSKQARKRLILSGSI